MLSLRELERWLAAEITGVYQRRIHSALLRKLTVKDFAEMVPDRFNNKTNGITPRRWLLLANRGLAGAITDASGYPSDAPL